MFFKGMKSEIIRREHDKKRAITFIKKQVRRLVTLHIKTLRKLNAVKKFEQDMFKGISSKILNTVCMTNAKECGIIYSKLEAIGMGTKGKVFISFSEAFDELSFTGTTGMWLDAYLLAEEINNPVIHRNHVSENPNTKRNYKGNHYVR